jgi:hypothetical protein
MIGWYPHEGFTFIYHRFACSHYNRSMLPAAGRSKNSADNRDNYMNVSVSTISGQRGLHTWTHRAIRSHAVTSHEVVQEDTIWSRKCNQTVVWIAIVSELCMAFQMFCLLLYIHVVERKHKVYTKFAYGSHYFRQQSSDNMDMSWNVECANMHSEYSSCERIAKLQSWYPDQKQCTLQCKGKPPVHIGQIDAAHSNPQTNSYWDAYETVQAGWHTHTSH